MATRDPFEEPFWRPEDLGLAIPESDHAVSVCLPRWRDVIGYEEGDPEVIDTFECGYPRFVPHPYVAELFLAAQAEFAKNAKKPESAIVFPSLAAAWRCADYVKRRTGTSCRLESYGWGSLTVVLLDETAYDTAWKYWQHSGEIVSSRLAETALADAPLDPALIEAGEQATGLRPPQIAFVSSNGWDALAATWYGFQTLWVNRQGLPQEEIGPAATREATNLNGVLDMLA
jgi:cystathionine gamma-synthase